MNQRFVHIFMQARRRMQIPLAIALVITATAFYFFKEESAAILVCATTAIVCLAVVAELMRVLREFTIKNECHEWEDHVDAAPVIKAKTITHCQSTYHPEVWCFGMTLLDQLALIRTTLTHLLRSRPTHVTLHLALLDPGWSKLSSFNPKWKCMTETLLSYLRFFVEHHQEQFKQNRWTVHIYFYRNKPSEFGLLAGDDLFLGSAYWSDNKVLMAGQNRIKWWRGDDGDEAREKMRNFKARFVAECKQVEVLGHAKLKLA